MPQLSARGIVVALKGRWGGNSGSCKCPAHEDRSPSLSVTDGGNGRVLIHCFGGCQQLAVIEALQRLGLWGERGARQDPSAPWNFVPREPIAKNDPEKRNRAMTMWEKAKPIAGTLAETYLRSRGVRGLFSDQLRYHPSIPYSPDKSSWPCMIARLSDNRGLCAIQRTYLARDGSGKAPVDGPKRTLGGMGAGAVRLKPLGPSGFLGVAEGVETAMSASQLYAIPVWACLGAYRLGSVELPEGVKVVTIFGDAGDTGRAQAFKAQDVFEARGLHVECIFPGAHFGDAEDFNAALQADA